MEYSLTIQQKKVLLHTQSTRECEISGQSEPTAFMIGRASPCRGSLRITFFALICLLLICNNYRAALASLPAGSGAFLWNDKTGASDPHKPLKVYYYRPAIVTATTPVWFIMHGTERNADEYRDCFIQFAVEQGALVMAPQFDAENWP